MTKIVNPASGGGVPDEAWTEVDLTNAYGNLFTGMAYSFGTDGYAFMRWARVGRQIFMKGAMHFDADADVGVPILPDTEMPYLPLPPSPGVKYPAFVSEFAYAAYYETSPGATDGTLRPLGITVAYTGGGSGLLLIQLSGNLTDGGSGNLWQTATPFDGTGRVFDIVYAANYEAESAV
jgi:hypothetical protein